MTAVLCAGVALALSAPAAAALTTQYGPAGATAQKGPDPIPNPGPSGTPTPGPSYSPPPDPKASEPPPSAEQARRAAQDGQKLAQAEGAAFASSFEPGDPQPTWINTTETDAKGDKKAENVTGTLPGGIEGSISDRIARISVSGEFFDAGEVKENLADTDASTKWLVDSGTGWAQYELSEPVAVVHYALTSADDVPERDPRDWQLQGSQDGKTWTTLDTRTGETFSARLQRKEYRFANTTPYAHYRLNVTRVGGAPMLQLAEWELSDGHSGTGPPSDMRSHVGEGPTRGHTSRPRAGFTGLRAFRYAGGTTSGKGGYSTNKVFEVDIPVTSGTELSYLVFPEFTSAHLRYPSTYVSVDLAFSDGTYLSDLKAVDQHGVRLAPREQGESKTLYADQWNFKRAEIGKVARGKRISRILVAYDSPVGEAGFRGWVDDIKIVTERKRQPYEGRGGRDERRPSEYAVTTRGTHSTGGFSRGNNFPATAVPHGFNFWTPMTDAASTRWLYEYHRANNAANLPEIQAFTASHEPSPWMGDRQTFQFMPSAAEGAPDPSRTARALPFRHEREVAQPHLYAVTFDNGLKTEIAPADHAALARFTFPGSSAKLIFDNVDNRGGLTLDVSGGVVTGYSDVRSDLSTGATRMFYYATFDRPVTGGGKLTGQGRDSVLGYLAFDAGEKRTVSMRIASSLISVEQARKNLELEIGASDTLEQVSERARKAWDAKLGVIEVEGASQDQLVTLYSNLYRLFLYPNSAFENTGTADAPVYRHAVQSAVETPPSTPTETGAKVADGKVYVNNGFWDTYRTTWPAYALLTPKAAGEMVDGFVRQYEDGGWIARWSSPGYADLMVGTSSDVAFADAHLKGITGFDAETAYEAAVKNATVTPTTRHVGRKGLSTSVFLGYTSTESTGEAMSWAMDGYINDFGIANMAKSLAERSKGAKRARYLEEHEYFRNRALNYVHMFDPAVRFFQGRNADGSFRLKPDAYDPREWGHDYTETNGWNMAFHVPQDGRGLANLYGGADELAGKLDAFFDSQETALFPGSYNGVIHEMREARDVRMGQYGHSNQPSHHIAYMYDYAGRPWKTQAKVREALSRLYLGSEIGQGYPGDEDNGEMSAWQVFSALGFYPLQMGSPYYAIGSPLFEKATVRLENGRKLVIRAPGNSARNVYVQEVKVNGKPYGKTYLPHDLVAKGGELVFEMGPKPSRWGTGRNAAPPSITGDDRIPTPLHDLTGPGRGTASAPGGADVSALFDDDSATGATVPESVRYSFDGERTARYYTLTSGSGEPAQDPSSWVLEGSKDGNAWKSIDKRTGESFTWRSQTRPFKITSPSAYTHYRIRFTGGSAVSLAEVELLAPEPPATSTLVIESSGVFAAPGETVRLSATVANHATKPAGGRLTATGPEGWTVQPASAPFGPIAPGASQTLTFEVAVPATAGPGSHVIRLAATSDQGSTGEQVAVTLIGDTVEFTPGTPAEEPWLLDAGGSQLDGEVHDGRARFTDGDSHATYRFELPAQVTGGSLTLDIANQFLVEVSEDQRTWRTVLREENDVRDRSNRAERTLDLADLRGESRTFYLRIGDSRPDDGWGSWLARVRLELTRTQA
ncbi:glycoside hydrolase family 92 protein [Nonomuraea deserti]|uniref:Glycoside hydrolase family 92 protein n=1 Tax=Nonomuraea deserti TaxID=1848322 RepID=A0A4R4VBH1_9ACTN|nr:GH92 family glycosyl hydrolase [Nonomuraea deserti]TDD02749.1 glycoside hydrolase family 92 protein [Nonomuraea deserti]